MQGDAKEHGHGHRWAQKYCIIFNSLKIDLGCSVKKFPGGEDPPSEKSPAGRGVCQKKNLGGGGQRCFTNLGGGGVKLTSWRGVRLTLQIWRQGGSNFFANPGAGGGGPVLGEGGLPCTGFY